MALKWESSNDQVQGIPEHRKAFFEDIAKRIENEDPKAIGAIVEEICGQFQKLMTGELSYTSVPRFAPGDWANSPRHVIWDVTEDFDESRWWLGLLMIDTAVKYHYDLIGFRTHGERALRYVPDVRQFLNKSRP